MPSSVQIVNETTSRSRILGEHEHEGQFIVRSKFDLYSKPMSVCGHVFNYMPSIKARSFVPQKNSTLNEQNIKQSWSERETLLQSENPTRFSRLSELGMVGSGNATPLHSSSDSPVDVKIATD